MQVQFWYKYWLHNEASFLSGIEIILVFHVNDTNSIDYADYAEINKLRTLIASLFRYFSRTSLLCKSCVDAVLTRRRRIERERKRERGRILIRTSRSCFLADEHLRLFLSPFAHSSFFLLYFRVRVSMKGAYSWKIFFSHVDDPAQPWRDCRRGRDKERLVPFMWRAWTGRLLEGLASSFSKQRLFASR